MPKITRTSAGAGAEGFSGIRRASQVRRISTTVIMDGRAEGPRSRSAPARSRAGGAVAPGGRRLPRRRLRPARARAGGAAGAGRGARASAARRSTTSRRLWARSWSWSSHGRSPRGDSRRPAGAPRRRWSRSCGSISSRRVSGTRPRRSTARRAPSSRLQRFRASMPSMRRSRAICRIWSRRSSSPSRCSRSSSRSTRSPPA